MPRSDSYPKASERTRFRGQIKRRHLFSISIETLSWFSRGITVVARSESTIATIISFLAPTVYAGILSYLRLLHFSGDTREQIYGHDC